MSGTIGRYFEKMKGGEQAPPAVGTMEIIWSGIGSFVGIFVCAYLTFKYSLSVVFLPVTFALELLITTTKSPLSA